MFNKTMRSFLHPLTLNSHLKALIKLLIEHNEEKHIGTEFKTFRCCNFGFEVHASYCNTFLKTLVN